MTSYAAARVHAMRATLIPSTEYARLTNMSADGILAYLQGTQYKEDIDSLSLKDLTDIEMIDKVLARNDARTVRKLERFSTGDFREALETVLRMNDRWNVALIADAITGGKDPREALLSLARQGTFDPLPLTTNTDITSLSLAVTRKLGTPRCDSHSAFLEALAAGVEGSGLTSALAVDEANIVTLLRSLRQGTPAAQIHPLLVRGGLLSRSTLRDAAATGDVRAAISLLEKTRYADEMRAARAALEDGRLARFEGELHARMLARIRRRTSAAPLGPDVLAGYLAEKALERANLRLLMKGKRLGLSPEFLRERVIA